MIRRIRLALVVASAIVAMILLAMNRSFSQDAASPSPSISSHGNGNSQHDPNGGMKHFWEKRTYGNKPIPKGAYKKAKDQWDALPDSGALPAKKHGKGSPKGSGPSANPTSNLSPSILSSISSLSGTVWEPIGPSPIDAGSSHFWNGRVNSIAISPSNPNVIFLGTTGGGVWRTNDAGDHWTPLTDHEPMLAIGEPSALAIDPNNTNVVYVGSSTAVNNTTGAQGAALNTTIGILKTTDGGGSWINLGSGFPAGNTGNASQFVNTNIYAIVVDPANSNIVYLAGNLGLWTSVDGGKNWTRGTNGNLGTAESLALDPSSPPGNRVLFAGVNGVGVLRSNDGGGSWTLLLNSATPAVSTALTAHAGPMGSLPASIGKVAVALAPPAATPNPAGVQVIYLTIEGRNGDFIPSPYTQILGIFQSTDQGATWSLRNAGATLQCQCFYTNTIAVDPASPGDGVGDIILWGGTNSFLSTDAGANFSDITNGIHADSHAWAFAPQPSMPSILYAGNDGGIWRSTDSGATWTGTGAGTATINSGGLQVAQFYHMDLKYDATASVSLGALQDNGTVQWTGSNTWLETRGGDGLVAVFDVKNTNTAYAVNNGGPAISTDSGGTWADITSNLPNNPAGDDQVQIFRNTLNVDPGNGGVLYFGGAANTDTSPSMVMHPGELFQSRDSGATWNQVTSFTANANVGPAAAAPANNGNNVAVVDGGNAVYVSTNAMITPVANVAFTNITRNLPNRAVTRLAFDPNDPDTLYAVMSGFNSQTPGSPGHVFATHINGGNWTDISPAVDVPFDAIVLDGNSSPTTIYAGTDLGVVRSVDGGNSWTKLDSFHFPNSPVTDLQINSDAGVLRAGTFGRGIFEFAAPSGPVVSVSPENNLQFGDTCLGTTATLTLTIANVGTTDLIINSVQQVLGSADFSVQSNPATPVTISPDAHLDFTVQFQPAAAGSETATIRISSNDPAAPTVDLTATGSGSSPILGTVMPDSGNFGDVCVGSFKDLDLTITDGNACPLSVTGINSTDPTDFKIASVISFPLNVAGNGSIEVPIRFQPAAVGAKSGSIAITSNGGSAAVAVSGNAPPGQINVSGPTTFGEVCAGTNAQQNVTIANTGLCNLQILSATVDCPDFTIQGSPFPATLSHDSSLPLTIAFTPTSIGTKSCTLTITSDDPSNPVVMETLTATTPAANIDVPSPEVFAPTVIQSVGACQSQVPFPVSNNGTCPLQINSVVVGGANGADYSLAGLPSLATPLQPGHVLGEGNLDTVFKPTQIARAEQGNVTVTYVSDPFLNTTAEATSDMCGEGVSRGVRVLVTDNGVPLASVDKIQISRLTSNRKSISVDNVMNATLQAQPAVGVCAPFSFQYEWGGATNPIQLTAGDYQLTVSTKIGKKRKSKTVSFTLGTCSFNQNVVVKF
jgi:HYDIN/CFA65/VesB-like, Ig-like domain